MLRPLTGCKKGTVDIYVKEALAEVRWIPVVARQPHIEHTGGHQGQLNDTHSSAE